MAIKLYKGVTHHCDQCGNSVTFECTNNETLQIDRPDWYTIQCTEMRFSLIIHHQKCYHVCSERCRNEFVSECYKNGMDCVKISKGILR